MSEDKPKSVQCKYCKIYGLEWYKNDEGANRLRWVSDKQAHSRDECDNIKNKVEGYTFYDVIAKHKANKGSSQPEADKVPPRPEIKPEVDLSQFVTALEDLTDRTIILNESFKKFSEQLLADIKIIKEQFSNIPGFDENLQAQFQKASEQIEAQQ